MKKYIKPSLDIEALMSDSSIANDSATLGEVDPVSGEEFSIPAGEGWGDLL